MSEQEERYLEMILQTGSEEEVKEAFEKIAGKHPDESLKIKTKQPQGCRC